MKKLILVLALTAAGAVYAQDKGDKGDGNVKYNKTTSYDFEDDTIEGDLTKPDGEYVEARKKVQHSNLIRIREDFKEEVMQSVGEL
ncbi:MAG: adventurous gliding motility protein CglF [Myxococcaceae bacterium]